METWLHVAEKPSVAKELVRHMSQNQQCRQLQSYSRYNSVTEFRAPQGLLERGGAPMMIVTSVTGHLMELKFEDGVKSWEGVDPKLLFTASVSKYVKEDNKPIERNLEVYGAKATRIVLWLDCDREGENIAHEVLLVCGRVNRNLAISRAKFSALTQRDVVRAVNALVRPDERSSDAVDARQEMDLRIGAAFTRFQTLQLRSRFEGLPKVISFGPCQIPTLGFVVDRHLARESFIPESFYYIQVTHNEAVFTWATGRLFDHGVVLSMYRLMLGGMTSSEAVAPESVTATVKSVRRQTIKRYTPFPLSTVTLQKLASRHLRISSERCMSMAESLYQEGFLSYPRTETEVFTATDDELRQLVSLHVNSRDFGGYAGGLLNAGEFRRPRAGRGNDNAHPPIHPTKFYDKGDERQALYDLVARHFLASCSHDATGADCNVTISIGQPPFDEAFSTSGFTVLERKWLDVFPFERWVGRAVPRYDEGQTFVPTSATVEQGRTAPPNLLSESDLISAMDKHGIGTDATIAQHIKTIRDRNYVVVERGMFVPTALGMALASVYGVVGEDRLLQPSLRARTEKEMNDIARGMVTKGSVLQQATQLYLEIFTTVSNSARVFVSTFAKHFAATSASSGRVLQQRFTVCGVCRGYLTLVEMSDEQRVAICEMCETGDRYVGPLRLPRQSQLAAHGHICPICQYGVINVTNIQTGKSHTLCPRCFNDPPPSFAAGSNNNQPRVGDIEATTGPSSMRCFQCSHDCPLAGTREGDGVHLRTCPNCNQHPVVMKRSKAGSTFLGCSGYPNCTYSVFLFPHQKCVPTRQRCGTCGAVQLQFVVSVAEILPAVGEPEFTCCLWCDGRVSSYVTEKTTPAVARGGMPPQRGRGRGRGSRSNSANTRRGR